MGKRPLEVAPEAAELASLLNARFTEAGFSQARISRELSISRPRVAAILDASSAMTVSELLQLSALLELDPGQLLAEAETSMQSDLDANIPLPDDWEASLAARRVENSPEAREDAFLDSLGEEPQE
nr:MAG TPA: LAMBDA REPRESSOR (TRIPLE MUTANT)/DNA COMPLEX-DNA COMPLEX, DOUBLE HELIX, TRANSCRIPTION-DNA.1A [Caudoviricetes sp.]